MGRKIAGVIIGGIFILLGAFISFVGYKQMAKTKNYQEVQAKVNQIDAATKTANVTVNYSYSGKDYYNIDAGATNNRGNQYGPGSAITIKIDPSTPENAIIPGQNTSMIFLGLAVVTLGIAIIVIFLVKNPLNVPIQKL